MHCRHCGIWLVASLDQWVPGRCHNCGEFPPFDLPAEQERDLRREKVWTSGSGSFSSNNGYVPPEPPRKPPTPEEIKMERLKRMGVFGDGVGGPH